MKSVPPAANRRRPDRSRPVSRPALPRSQPIRNFAGVLGPRPPSVDPPVDRTAGAAAARGANAARPRTGERARRPSPGAKESPTSKRDPGAAVARGVNAGYRVIEEYLRQGQDFARTLWPGSASTGGGTAGAPMNMTERLIRSASDLAGLFSEFLQTFSLPGTLPPPGSTPIPGFGIDSNGTPGSAPTAGPSPAAGASVSAEPAPLISIDLRSARRAEVTVNVRPGAWADRLLVHDLRPRDGDGGARLTGVSATGVPADRRVVVAATISADQPADTYSGLIVDADTNLPRGTVAIRIFADGPAPRANAAKQAAKQAAKPAAKQAAKNVRKRARPRGRG